MFFACLYICVRVSDSPGSEVTNIVSSHVGGGELNLGPVEEQLVLPTAEPSLQSWGLHSLPRGEEASVPCPGSQSSVLFYLSGKRSPETIFQTQADPATYWWAGETSGARRLHLGQLGAQSVHSVPGLCSSLCLHKSTHLLPAGDVSDGRAFLVLQFLQSSGGQLNCGNRSSDVSPGAS